MRKIKSPEERKISMTFSLPLYVINWIDKMKSESPGFDRNKFMQDRFDEYMEKRGDK